MSRPLIPGQQTKVLTVRLPESMMDKLKRLGGIEWLRAQIAKAKI